MNFLKRLLLAAIRIGIGVLALAATYSAWSGQTPARLLYFTTETNIGIGVVFIWAGLAVLLKGVEPPAWLKGALTLYILITGIVGTFILPVPSLATEPVIFGVLARTFVVHRVVPLLALADFVLFDVHRRYKWHYAFSWLSWPLFFLLLILAHAHFMPAQGISGLADDRNPWPYGFMNLAKLGVAQFSVNMVLLLVAFVVVGGILLAVDRLLPAKPLLLATKA